MIRKTGYPSKDKLHLKGVRFTKRHPLIITSSMYCSFVALNLFHMNETAIEIGNQTITKKQVKKDTQQVIRALKSMKIKKGARIAIVTPNVYEGIILNLAANAIGVATVFLNHTDTPENIAIDVISHNSPMLVIYGDDEAYARKIQKIAPSIEHIIYVPSSDKKLRTKKQSVESDYFSWDAFIARATDYRKPIAPSILANLRNKEETIFLQTSGSSGKSKNLPFNNRNVSASLIYCSNSTGVKVRDQVYKRCLTFMPYRLPYGWGMIFLNLIGGQTVIIPDGIDSNSIGEFYKYRPNVIYGTPTALKAMIDNTPADADLSSLKVYFSGGFLLPLKWHEESMEFFWRHGVHPQICNDYGMGESLCVGTTSKDTQHYHSTVGKFFVGPKWLLIDENLKEVKYNQPGEIVIHSKSLIKGYYGNARATKDAFIKIKGKTYYRTHDYASMDEDGIITFIGRKKRFYLTDGAPEKIYCESVENVIMSSGLTAMCAVVPREDKDKAIVGRACVVLKDKELKPAVAEKQLIKYLTGRLLDYQMPQEFVFLDEMPIMSSGKINYLALENDKLQI